MTTSTREPLIEHGLRIKTYRLSKVVLSPSNLYHLKDRPERVLVKEELMLIPKTQSFHQIMSKNGDASKNELPDTKTIRAEQSSAWVNSKVVRSANKGNLPN